jgi:hypothetical protein
MNLLLENPLAIARTVVAVLFAWSILGNREKNPKTWNARKIIRTFGPSAFVFILALHAGMDLKVNLPRVDFGMFYSSALLLKQEPQNLYNPDRQTDYLHAATGLVGENHYLPFAYPPFVAFLFEPLTALSYRCAFFVMLGINIALVTFTFWWLTSRLRYSADQILTFLILASAALPLYAFLFLGHLTSLSFLFLSLFIIEIMGTRKWRAGLWTGLLLFKPILFPVPLLLILWKRQWKALALFVGTAFPLLLFSLILVGWDGIRANARMLLLMTDDSLLPKNQSLRGLVYAAGLGTTAWVLLSAATIACLWIAFSRARDQRWIYAAAMLAVMLVPPYIQFHDLTIGLISLAIVLSNMNRVSDKTRNGLFLLILVPPAIALQMPKDHAVFPVMPVVLIVMFAWCLWKGFRQDPDSAARSKDGTIALE